MVSQHQPGAPAALPATALRRPMSTVAVACAVAAVATRLVAPGVLDRFSLAIGITGILLGIPHGAVDHMVPFWASGRRPSGAGLLRVLLAYVLIGATAIGAMVLAPTVTLVVFLVASAVHFGQAEVEFVAERRALPAARSPRIDRLRVAAHGLTVVALPTAIWHDRVAVVLRELAPALAGQAAWFVFAAVAAVAVALDLALLRIDLAGRHRQEAGETVLLVLLMVTVPPLPAFAVYFGAWHALRHTARLLPLPGAGGVPLSMRAALRRYVVHALPPTIVVLVALFAAASTGNRSVLTSALAVLIALTFPHMRTVAAFDRGRRAGGTQPPAIAPMMRSGSVPSTTTSGNVVSGESWDRSSSPA